jgi:hypothetical protein
LPHFNQVVESSMSFSRLASCYLPWFRVRRGGRRRSLCGYIFPLPLLFLSLSSLPTPALQASSPLSYHHQQAPPSAERKREKAKADADANIASRRRHQVASGRVHRGCREWCRARGRHWRRRGQCEPAVKEVSADGCNGSAGMAACALRNEACGLEDENRCVFSFYLAF